MIRDLRPPRHASFPESKHVLKDKSKPANLGILASQSKRFIYVCLDLGTFGKLNTVASISLEQSY